jgi:periplasmic protein TonB
MVGVRRDIGLDPAQGLVLAVVVHLVLYFFAGTIDPPKREQRDLIEVEVIELPPEKKIEPPKPPEPEKIEPPEPEPEKPEPKIEPKKPPPKPRVAAKPEPEPEPEPAPPAKPKRFELPPSSTVPDGGGDVKVNTGPGTSSGSNSGSGTGTGTGTGTGNGTGPGGGNGTGTKAGVPWAPKNDLYIAKQPTPLRIPELECPAVTERQIQGTVVLMVQVQRDGKVRSARVTQKLGHGCDDIAKKALRTAKFAPAMGTDGKTADYELRYEYAFELQD